MEDMEDLVLHLMSYGIKDEDLDDLVHDQASREASGINNDGMREQVRYLLECGWSEDDICDALDVMRPA